MTQSPAVDTLIDISRSLRFQAEANLEAANRLRQSMENLRRAIAEDAAANATA